jgi:hypothetical protein
MLFKEYAHKIFFYSTVPPNHNIFLCTESVRFEESANEPCGIVFYYHIFGPAVGRLELMFR